MFLYIFRADLAYHPLAHCPHPCTGGLNLLASRVTVNAQIPPSLPAAQIDECRLQQVVVNLLRNTIRHTPPGGIVAVTASVTGNHLQIDVCDTGEGIDPDDLPHIWERFYRGKNAQ